MDVSNRLLPLAGPTPTPHRRTHHAIALIASLLFGALAFPSFAAPAPRPHQATLLEQVERINPAAVSRALDDMARAWPDRIDAAALRARLGDLAARRESALRVLTTNSSPSTSNTATAQANALLADVHALAA